MFGSKTLNNIILIVVLLVLGLFALHDKLLSSRQKGHIFTSPQIGKFLPEFVVSDIYSDQVISGEALRIHPADIKIINFFASWCESCLSEHELLLQIVSKLDIPIYGLAWRDNTRSVKQYLSKHGNPYQMVGEIDDISYRMHFHLVGVPHSLVVDRNNKIIAHFKGPITTTNFNYFLNQYNENSFLGYARN
jgi:cytochrome c biogenesis protein CcmG, thiol:disulfide interchange protein DsbE